MRVEMCEEDLSGLGWNPDSSEKVNAFWRSIKDAEYFEYMSDQ
jgi:hypothetical protein